MTDNTKNRCKLPDRYPREKEILLFGDMSELDHVLELLAELGKFLSGLPPTTTDKEWEKYCLGDLAHLVRLLSKAYIEYERFWSPAGWVPSPSLLSDLSDYHEVRWLVKDIEGGPYYDPAQLSCARALHMVLVLTYIPGESDWVEYCVDELRYELTRYHAAALEIVQHRNSVYLSDAQEKIVAAHEEIAAAEPDIKTGRKLRSSAQNRAEQQKQEADIKAETIVKKLAELHIGKRRKSQAVKLTAKALNISEITVWRALKRKTSINPAD